METKIEEKQQKYNWTYRVGLILTWLVLIVSTFAVVSFFLLQTPYFQGLSKKFISNNISSKTSGQIIFNKLEVSFLDKVSVDKIVFLDHFCDTIIQADKAYFKLNFNPFNFTKEGIKIESISIEGLEIEDHQYPRYSKSSIGQLIDEIGNPRNKNASGDPTLNFALNTIELKDGKYQNINHQFNNTFELEFDQLSVYTRSSITGDFFSSIKTIDIQKPTVHIEQNNQIPDSLKSIAKYPNIDLEEFCVTGGLFEFVGQKKDKPFYAIKYNELGLKDIEVNITNLDFCDNHFTGTINQISAIEKSGFELSYLKSNFASINNKEIKLDGLEIITPNSFLKDSLHFTYSDFSSFQNFSDEVNMKINFDDSKVFIYDIMRFAPTLGKTDFFAKNKFRTVFIDGAIDCNVANLNSQNLSLGIEGMANGKFDFSFKNLNKRNSQFATINFKKVTGNTDFLKPLIANENILNKVEKVSQFTIDGNFEGFFDDFHANATINSDIGTVDFQTKIYVKQGLENAIYSGDLRLIDFELGTIFEDPSWEKGDFSLTVKNGTGLTLESAKANVSATAEKLLFKNYNYKNASIDGILNQKQFVGDFTLSDDHIDFDFNGFWKFDSVPEFDFKVSIGKLNLLPLNLSNRNIKIGGEATLKGKGLSIANFEGSIRGSRFSIKDEFSKEYLIDLFSFNSTKDSLGKRLLKLESDQIFGYLEGNLAPGDILYFVKRAIDKRFLNLPNFFDQNLQVENKYREDLSSKFQINIKNDFGLASLFNQKLNKIEGLKIEGNIYEKDKSVDLNVVSPILKIGNTSFFEIESHLKIDSLAAQFDFSTESILNGKLQIPAITVLGIKENDLLKFGLNIGSIIEGNGSNLNLNGVVERTTDSLYLLNIQPNSIKVFNEVYTIEPNNKILFGKNTFNAQNFKLASGQKSISIGNLGLRGVKLNFENFGLEYFNQVFNYPPLQFGGQFDTEFSINNLKNLEDIGFKLKCGSLLINEDNWGLLQIESNAKDLRSDSYTYLTLTKAQSQLIGEGKYQIGGKNKNYLDFRLDLSGFPLEFAEYFVDGTLSNIEGTCNANVSVFGLLNELNIEGSALLSKGGLKVDFLNTNYSFDPSIVNLENGLFDFSGARILDEFGNVATINGGISHNNLKDLGFAASLTTDKILGLNTEKGDNEIFYGKAVGSGEVTFNGPLGQPSLYVNAEVGEETELVIPVSSGQESSALSFINFTKSNDNIKSKSNLSSTNSKGVDLEMDLTITNPAVVKIIFDEQAGDVLEGSGKGNIKIFVPREGNFQMFGDYEIEEGDYLFTLYNIINKRFSIQRGGLIRWSGDPFNADINITARYQDLNTSVANFIQEYLISSSDATRAEASNATNVNLNLLLKGKLLQPIIDFDLSFPNLTGEVQSFTDSKLRVLKQDPNELNKQVFGLIVAGQFLPADFAFQGTEVLYNTMSEFVSNQLSLLITQLFSELIEEGDVLSGIDFDIAYFQYQKVNLSEGEDLNKGDELKVRLTQNYFDDRLTVLLGGNLELNNNLNPSRGTTGAFLGNDLVIEYAINKDRTLKVKVYQRLQPDFSGRRVQVGTGLSFRKEFDNFSDFFKNLKSVTQKINN